MVVLSLMCQKYAVSHGIMHSPLDNNVLLCKLTYGIDNSVPCNVKFNCDKPTCYHSLFSVSVKVTAKENVLKNMAM